MISSKTLFGRDAPVLRDTSFQLLLLANVTGGPLGTALVSPLLDTFTGVFGVSETHVGLIITVFTTSSILLIPLIGFIANRVGRKPVLIAGLLVFGL